MTVAAVIAWATTLAVRLVPALEPIFQKKKAALDPPLQPSATAEVRRQADETRAERQAREAAAPTTPTTQDKK